MKHLTMTELEAGLEAIRQSPKDGGVLALIVRRPQVGAREVLDEGHLDVVQGLVGDNWRTRGSSRTPDGSAHPDMQLNVMNARMIALVAQEKARWPLAGDQLFIDMDLSADNVPPGTHLALGAAVIAVTAAFSRRRDGVGCIDLVRTILGLTRGLGTAIDGHYEIRWRQTFRFIGPAVAGRARSSATVVRDVLGASRPGGAESVDRPG